MYGLAPGGHAPVAIFAMMGVSVLIVGALVDPLAGLMPLFGILCLMISAFFANFWRDPQRVIPKDAHCLVSPADGHVMFVRRERAIGRRPSSDQSSSNELVHDPLTGDWYPVALDNPHSFETEQQFEAVPVGEELQSDVIRIAIFMSPLDVHVNRACDDGTLVLLEHRTGKGRRRGPFLPAMKKESEFNERVRSVYELDVGHRIEITQISGALARTILPYFVAPQTVRRGQRIGMIRLGSRVDVRVPAELYQPQVFSAEDGRKDSPKGMFVRAGSTILFKGIQSESE